MSSCCSSGCEAPAFRQGGSTGVSAGPPRPPCWPSSARHELLADGVVGPVTWQRSAGCGDGCTRRPVRASRRRARRRAVPAHAAAADPPPPAGRAGRTAGRGSGRQADAAHGAGDDPRRERGLRAGRGGGVALQHLAATDSRSTSTTTGATSAISARPMGGASAAAASSSSPAAPTTGATARRSGLGDRLVARAGPGARARHRRPPARGVPGRPRSGRSRRRCSRATSPARGGWSMAAGMAWTASPPPTGPATPARRTRSGASRHAA